MLSQRGENEEKKSISNRSERRGHSPNFLYSPVFVPGDFFKAFVLCSIFWEIVELLLVRIVRNYQLSISSLDSILSGMEWTSRTSPPFFKSLEIWNFCGKYRLDKAVYLPQIVSSFIFFNLFTFHSHGYNRSKLYRQGMPFLIGSFFWESVAGVEILTITTATHYLVKP